MPLIKKLWSDKIAKENFQAFKENKKARMPWERDAVRYDDFRYANHFSRAEEAQMLAFKQAPLPISITTAICDTAEAMEIASKPIIKTAPLIFPYDDARTDQSKKVAAKYNFLIQRDWYDSLGNLQYDRVVRDRSNVGHGFFYVVPKMDYGEFSVDIKHMSWRNVYPHEASKDPFYRDMDDCVIAMRVSKEAGYRFARSIEPALTYAEYEEEFVKGDITLGSGSELYTKYSPNFRGGKGVLFCVRLKLVDQKSYLLIPKQVPDGSVVTESMVRQVMELTPDMKEKAKQGLIEIKERNDFFCTEYTSIGNKGYELLWGTKNYNLIPSVYDHRDNPYPLGRVSYLYPIQRALNKFIMIAILNGSILNTTRLLAEENSIVDNYELDTKSGIPGSKILYKLPIPGVSAPPTIIKGEPLNNAWLDMPKYLAYLMETISGIYGTMMGDSRDTPTVFSTVASLQSAGGIKIKRRLAQSDATLSIVGQRVAEFYQEYAPFNGFATIIDQNGDQSEPEFYNTLRYKKDSESRELEVDPETDLSLGVKAVRFTSASSNGYESGTEAALLTTLATQLSVPALVPLILKRLNIPDVDKIVDQMSQVNQLSGQLENAQKVINDLESRSKVLASQVTQKALEAVVSEFKAKYQMELQGIKNTVEGGPNAR